MSGPLFIGIMTFTNFLIVLKMTAQLIKNNSEKPGHALGNQRLRDSIADLIQEKNIENAIGSQRASISEPDKTQTATNRRTPGINPDLVKLELGHFRSETGIIAASSKRYADSLSGEKTVNCR